MMEYEIFKGVGGILASISLFCSVLIDLGNPNELAAMVAEINMDQVALDERLSNQVYHYDKELRTISHKCFPKSRTASSGFVIGCPDIIGASFTSLTETTSRLNGFFSFMQRQ